MIRTRDFLLFVVVLLFLGIGVATTLFGTGPVQHDEPVQLTDGIEVSGANVEDQEIDRQSIIDRLREKIRTSDLVITPAPSVTADVGVASSAEETALDNVHVLKRCAAADDTLAMVPHWPLNKVQFSLLSGMRTVYTSEEVVTTVAAVASGTPAAESTETVRMNLLSVPQTPVKLSEPACVPSEVIGVSQRGALMFNGDMRAYRGIPSDVLIGYARDGYPVYGVYDGEVDACGGYEHPSGYRYTVSADRDYIIGCYIATPQKIILK